MSAAPPVRYTTTIPAERTAAEIQNALAKFGAQRIAIDYQNGQPSGLSFALQLEDWGLRLYELPVDVDAMHSLMKRAGLPRGKMQSREQAERVAWRVTLTWVQAQLALIASQMVRLEDVMLPYMHVDSVGTTVRDVFRDQGGRLELTS